MSSICFVPYFFIFPPRELNKKVNKNTIRKKETLSRTPTPPALLIARGFRVTGGPIGFIFRKYLKNPIEILFYINLKGQTSFTLFYKLSTRSCYNKKITNHTTT
jgi:hypothetical protein